MKPQSVSDTLAIPGAIPGKILVAIPCLNESAHIAALIEQVLAEAPWPDRLIVVVDGGSTDGTQDIVMRIADRNPNVRLLVNPRRIQSVGVNLAAKLFGKGRRWLVRLDAHAGYPVNYIETLIAEAKCNGAASVVVSMQSYGEAGFQQIVATVQNSRLGTGGSLHRRPSKGQFVDHGHHALFDMAHFLAIGGYDETISYNEDAEFDIRLARSGGKIWLTDAVTILYFPRSTPASLFRQYICYGRGRANTILRHRIRPKLRQLLPAGVLPAVLGFFATPWLPAAGIPAIVWTLTCLIYGGYLAHNQGRFGGIQAGFAAMIIHLGWSIGFWAEMARGPNADDPGEPDLIAPEAGR